MSPLTPTPLEIRENFLHANIWCSTVLMTLNSDLLFDLYRMVSFKNEYHGLHHLGAMVTHDVVNMLK